MNKKKLCQYYTKKDNWLTDEVKKFIDSHNSGLVVDPFAGDGDLLNRVTAKKKIGYDLDPTLRWIVNDSLKSIPFLPGSLCITNPPYQSKSTDTRFNKKNPSIYFKTSNFDNLYKIAINNILDSFDYSVAIIPETFLQWGKFQERLSNVSILESNPFEDTDFPVLVACWSKERTNDFKIFKGNEFIGSYNSLRNKIINYNVNLKIIFNDINGQIGLIGIDGVSSNQKIRFCYPNEINDNEIKPSSRLRTRIYLDCEKPINYSALIDRVNINLEKFRSETKDVLLSPFKGNNQKGKRRRRLDYKLASNLIKKSFHDINLIENQFFNYNK